MCLPFIGGFVGDQQHIYTGIYSADQQVVVVVVAPVLYDFTT